MASIEWWRSLCPGVVDEWSSASWEPTGLDRAGRRQCRVKRSSIFTVPVLPGRLPRRVGRRGANCVRAGGMPETRTIVETTANMAATMGVQPDEAARSTATNVLRRPLRVEETAATVAWVASDLASGVAGQVVNVCAGAIVSR